LACEGRNDREQFYVEDVRVPESPEHMRSILKRIRKGVDEGRLVYVHCLGGHGRTGTAAGCWLLDRGIAADGEEALEIICKARLRGEVGDLGVMGHLLIAPKRPVIHFMTESISRAFCNSPRYEFSWIDCRWFEN
jgi:hypothetical protein